MAVLQRRELESSPLADLHAIASELGIEGFRGKRKDDLIGAILAAQGGEEPEEEREPDEVPSEEALEPVFAGEPEEPEPEEPEPEEPAAEEEPAEADEAEAVTEEGEEVVEEEPEVEEEEVSDEEIATGVLDVLANGSGFLRLDPAGQSRGDVY